MPITWQNVNQADVSTAWRAMDSAQRSINGAFDGLTNQVAKSEDIQAKNNLAERNNNTQAYLDQVAQLGKTPEQLQAAMQNGAIDQLKASFGPNIDHEKVRGAAENLLDQRYKQAQEAIGFNNVIRNEKTAPFVDQLRQSLLTGNKEAEALARKNLSDNGYRDFATQDAFARNLTHENLVWDEEKKGYVRAQEKHVQDIKASNAQIGYQAGMLKNAQANTAISAREATVHEGQYKLQVQDHISKQLSEKLESLTKVGSNTMDSPVAQKAMVDLVKEMYPNDQKVRESMLAGIAHAGQHRIPLTDRDGKPMIDPATGKPMSTGIPMNDVYNAIMASKDDRNFMGRWLNNDTGQGANILKAALTSADNPETVNRALATAGTKQILQGSIGRLTKQYNASIDAMNGDGSPAKAVPAAPAVSPAKQILAGADASGDSTGEGPGPSRAARSGWSPAQIAAGEAAQAKDAGQKPAPAKLSLEAQAKREYTELNRGTRTDLSPEVKAFRKEQAKAADEAEKEANKKRLAAELQRELRKARGLQ